MSKITIDYSKTGVQSHEVEYFKEHQLPGQDWVGWSEDVDLNNVKVKMINHEGLPNNEFNVWDKDIESANNQGNVPLPHINYK